MNLKEKIQEDLKVALKLQRSEEVSVLRLIMAPLINQEKEKIYRINTDVKNEGKNQEELAQLSQLTEEEVEDIISYEAKKRKESILAFEKGNRKELAEKEERELEILKKYLPEQISESDLKNIVKQIIEKLGARGMKDVGSVMKGTIEEVGKRADGKIILEIAKELLNND
ncbi:MAG: GatB/YqeY domain-containing protein [Patescibacteria group bacterium]